MSVTSANPEHLGDYVRTAGAGRVSVEDAQTAAAGQESSVVAGCPGRAVSSSALAVLGVVLDDMGSTDSFVAMVRDALLPADASGIVEIDDEVIAAAMLRTGTTLPPFNPWAEWIEIDSLPIDQRVEINRRRIASDLATETDPERRKLLQGWLAEYVDPIDGTTTVPQVLLYEPESGRWQSPSATSPTPTTSPSPCPAPARRWRTTRSVTVASSPASRRGRSCSAARCSGSRATMRQ